MWKGEGKHPGGRPHGTTDACPSVQARRFSLLRKLIPTKELIQFLNEVRKGMHDSTHLTQRIRAAERLLDKVLPDKRELSGVDGGPIEVVMRGMIEGPNEENSKIDRSLKSREGIKKSEIGN